MKKISITTKTGDRGHTRLFSGEDVSKNSRRLDAYGDLDELVSLLSIARHKLQDQNLKQDILSLQRNLFIVGSELATTDKKLDTLPQRVDSSMLKSLEKEMKALEDSVEIPRGFVIPGNSLGASYLDYARAISRRLERKVAGLLEDKMLKNETLLVWLNRLSDYLYLMARKEEKKFLLVKKS